MKKEHRKWLSVERRDLWDGPHDYLFGNLSADKLKYMLKHRNKKDLRMKRSIEDILVLKMKGLFHNGVIR